LEGRLKTVLFGLAMAVSAGLFMGMAQDGPKKWEYQVKGPVANVGLLINDFNELGDKGWELVGPLISKEPNGGKEVIYVCFKRPKR
jgi:hypothetical protein